MSEALERERRLRAEERAGRTTAERKLRAALQRLAALEAAREGDAGDAASASFRLSQIGVVRSVFAGRRGTPRQGSLAPATRGVLQLDKSVIGGAALNAIDGYSHVWLIFVFHENTNAAAAASGTVKAKVKPPLLGGKRVGLFATRSPHRPAPLGLTLARVGAVDEKAGTLQLMGLDLVDGTPVVDIKPVTAADSPSAAEFRVPEWVSDGASGRLAVVWDSEAQAAVEAAATAGALIYYGCTEAEVVAARTAISQVLALDVRSVHQGRGKESTSEQLYETLFDALRVHFRVERDGAAPTYCVRVISAEVVTH